MSDMEKLINEAKEILAHNIDFLLNKEDLTQHELAKEIGISQSMISDYKKGKPKKSVNLFTLLLLKQRFSVSIDDLVSVRLDDRIYKSVHKQEQAPTTNNIGCGDINRFVKKQFFCYFYETGKRNPDDVPQILEGTLNTTSLLKDGTVSASANLGDGSFSKNYEGIWTYVETRIYISLKNEPRREMCLIALPHVKSEKPYVGGVGSILSISRGKTPAPCYQHIILSTKQFCAEMLRDEIVVNALKMNNSGFHCYLDDECEHQLYKLIRSLPNQQSLFSE